MPNNSSNLAKRWDSVPQEGMQVYRVDPTTGKSESLPRVYDTALAEATLDKAGNWNKRYDNSVDPNTLHALSDAMKINGDLKISPEEVVALLAQEGRPDLGANVKDIKEGFQHNPQAVMLDAQLRQMGYNQYDAGTAALLLDKQQTASRLSKKFGHEVPWTAVWNGLGKTKEGRTGYDYAREYNMNLKNAPANQKAIDYVRRHMTDPEEQAQKQAAMQVELNPDQTKS